MKQSSPSVGISGFAAYLPPYRVRLEDWCRWTGESWPKVDAVVGNAFRMRGPAENAYTMAATAVLRLITHHRVDPGSVGFFGLGTETSTDNSAGAIIVKGMVNDALAILGRPLLSRRCEVPEFKHACLGGVYAMKAAARYLALDGGDRNAIVVCSDIAEYPRGSSGEPTQGAGAVAMLMQRPPRMLELELDACGSASDYRGPDFRKPFARFSAQPLSATGQVRDFPVFNGRYSTTCYVDEMLVAVEDMFGKLAERGSAVLRNAAAVFLHRPYQRMAETGLAAGLLYALATGDPDDRTTLLHYARDAAVDPALLEAELTSHPNVYARVREAGYEEEAFPLTMRVLRTLRDGTDYRELVLDKLRLGDAAMRECGNLYTASLPAWLAAGLEEAATRCVPLAGQRIVTLGYGSGDAAEAMPLRLVEGWEEAAGRLGFMQAWADPIDLDQHGYETLHDSGSLSEAVSPRPGTFVIDRVGGREAQLDDAWIEHYRYVTGKDQPARGEPS